MNFAKFFKSVKVWIFTTLVVSTISSGCAVDPSFDPDQKWKEAAISYLGSFEPQVKATLAVDMFAAASKDFSSLKQTYNAITQLITALNEKGRQIGPNGVSQAMIGGASEGLQALNDLSKEIKKLEPPLNHVKDIQILHDEIVKNFTTTLAFITGK